MIGTAVVLVVALVMNIVMRKLEPDNDWYLYYSLAIAVLFFIFEYLYFSS